MQQPERVLRLQGATNFRDLGGYPGHGGRPLRWRRLFRSDHLGGLTGDDRATLAALGLTRSFDFRGAAERDAAPYQLPDLQQHSLAIEPSVAQRMVELEAAGLPLTPARMAELMRELYRRLITERSDRFAEFFEHLRAAEAPIVFHCTAGKDRTGVAAALLLLALGVPREVVMQDYLLTDQVYRPPALAPGRLDAAVLAVLWGVQPDFLDAALHTIDTERGGLESFLTQRLGLHAAAREQLAARYLEGG
jgi:protein-tyrosine phosphatase